jgi:hypothetical protein
MFLTILHALLFLVVLPAAYLTLCERMRDSGVRHAPYFSYLVLTILLMGIGIWPLLLMSEKQPRRPAYELIAVVFLPLCCALSLLGRSQKSAYHRMALWSNLAIAVVYGWFLSRWRFGM